MKIEDIKGKWHFFKRKESDIITWIKCEDILGQKLFTFDKVNVYSFWTDYPSKLTAKEFEIFKKENPYLASFYD